MKKVKWTIMSLAIILSVCGAFATRPHFDCSNLQQYFLSGTSYVEAGTYGVDYTCVADLSSTCTYYTTNQHTFWACASGVYCTANCFVGQKPKDPKPKPVSSPKQDQAVH